jgi:hypothetical protein
VPATGSVRIATRRASWRPFAGPSGSDLRLQIHWERSGTLPPHRFASGDGEGPELIMVRILMVGVLSATPKMDVPGRTSRPASSVISVPSVVGALGWSICGIHGGHRHGRCSFLVPNGKTKRCRRPNASALGGEVASPHLLQ